eukprot:TRINITY_DN16786_c3_g1_i1.p1 TRINITY_DN16786_c3_g1~~TRINITY_DN16786_c3_g1_i1.p1  ORF type:complete len:268 (+),score=9.99 TRINITY_DN16786_c3_g1_i1:90-806(+)
MCARIASSMRFEEEINATGKYDRCKGSGWSIDAHYFATCEQRHYFVKNSDDCVGWGLYGQTLYQCEHDGHQACARSKEDCECSFNTRVVGNPGWEWACYEPSELHNVKNYDAWHKHTSFQLPETWPGNLIQAPGAPPKAAAPPQPRRRTSSQSKSSNRTRGAAHGAAHGHPMTSSTRTHGTAHGNPMVLAGSSTTVPAPKKPPAAKRVVVVRVQQQEQQPRGRARPRSFSGPRGDHGT